MEKLWQWLMRANARAVFTIALLALLLATGWWVREEMRARTDALATLPRGVGEPIRKTPVRLAVLDEVQRQLAVDPAWVPDTPFRPVAVGQRRRRPDDPLPDDTPPDVADAGVPARLPVRPRPGGLPGETPPDDPDDDTPLPGDTGVRRPGVTSRPGQTFHDDHIPFVILVYRGFFTRSDGVQLALIEDSQHGRQRFHPVGSRLYGLTLDDVQTSAIRIVTADGETRELPLGLPAGFSEGMPIE